MADSDIIESRAKQSSPSLESVESQSQREYFPPDLERRISSELGGFNEEEQEDSVDVEKVPTSRSRRSSVFQMVDRKFGLFDTEIKKQRGEILLQFLKVYVMMWVFMLTLFSLYWGSYYDRASRFKNLKMLVVNGDFQEVDSVPPLLGRSIEQVSFLPSISDLGNWKIINSTDLTDSAASHGNTIEEEIQRLVHHQKYWSAIYVLPNATYDYYQAFKSTNTSFDSNGTFVSLYFETGRDLLAMGSYVIPFVNKYQATWISNLSSSFYPQLLELLSSEEKTTLVTEAPGLLTSLPIWKVEDLRPSPSTVIIAPYQVGCIYLVIITFFQFNFFVAVHGKVAKFLKPKHFVIYRMISAQFSYLILSLGYSCVSAAFQVNFNLAYKGGFGVFWMVSYLTMAAVGGANENMAMIFFSTYPPLLGFWILSWVVLNISPSFSALALTSPFYRFGYAMPIHNSVELFKVILFNTYRGQMGRNFGILIAWIVINNLLMPFAMKFFGARMRLKAMAEAAANKK